MSGVGEQGWVRCAEADLRGGMTIRCADPNGRRVRPFVVIRRVPSAGGPCQAEWAWITTAFDAQVCFCDIYSAGGWIERLRDLDDAEEEGRRIACDIDDRKRAGDKQYEQSRRVLRGGLKLFGGPADGE